MKQNIALIGPRYSGKTMLAPNIAKALDWEQISTDQWIIEKSQMDIQTLVQKSGWKCFRDWEYQCLHLICKKKNSL